MKDYSLTKKNKKTFILYFEETDTLLIVHYASGEIKIFKNNLKTKRTLLQKMEEQVKNADRYKEMLEKEIDSIDFWKTLNNSSIIFPVFFLIFSNSPFGLEHIFWTSSVVLGTIGFTINQLEINQYKEKLKDLEKNEMYLEFAEIREEESKRILEEIYEIAKEKGATEERLQEIPKSLENIDEEININSVDKMTYLEMKEMLENAKRLKEMDFFKTSKQSNNPENEDVYKRQKNFKIYQFKEETKKR